MEKKFRGESPGTLELSPYRKRVRELITEFRLILEKEEYDFPEDTDMIVLLSGPSVDNSGTLEGESSPDNLARIAFSKMGLDQLRTKAHTQKQGRLKLPQFIINADSIQIEPLKQMAISAGIPENEISTIDCGPRGKANTKTQFEVFLSDPQLSKAEHPIFITSSYHVPRVARTAANNLPQELNYEVVGVPFKNQPFSVISKVKGEIRRIIQYSKKGDIAEYPKQQNN